MPVRGELLIAHGRGRDALVLRLAGLYGPGRVPRGADLTARRPIAGSPDAYLNLIHVEDAAAAVVAAAASGPVTARTYAVSDGHPPTRGEYEPAQPGKEVDGTKGRRVERRSEVVVARLAGRYIDWLGNRALLRRPRARHDAIVGPSIEIRADAERLRRWLDGEVVDLGFPPPRSEGGRQSFGERRI